jgi:hypothetical protein
METMMPRLLIGMAVYVAAGVLSIYIHDYGVGQYQTYMGGFTARGVGIGMATHSARYLFLITNIFVFAIPNLHGKLTTIATTAIFLLWYFLPDHPIRAIAYSGFTVCMSMFALIARAGIDQLFFRSKTSANRGA